MVLRLGPIVAVAAVTLLGACKYGTRPDDVLSTTQQIDLVESAPLAFAPWTNRAMPYCVGPGDKLRIKFTVTREMDEEVVVSPDGYIGARATGQISVEGRTVPEIENAIRRAARGTVTDGAAASALSSRSPATPRRSPPPNSASLARRIRASSASP